MGRTVTIAISLTKPPLGNDVWYVVEQIIGEDVRHGKQAGRTVYFEISFFERCRKIRGCGHTSTYTVTALLPLNGRCINLLVLLLLLLLSDLQPVLLEYVVRISNLRK